MNSKSHHAEALAQVTGQLNGLGSPNDLLTELRNELPELQIEDAFVVPFWFVQQNTWLKDPQQSDSVAYNYPLLFTVTGPLDLNALQQSLAEIVRRHSVLRSIFHLKGEKLVQIVLPPGKHTLPVLDLAGLPEPEKQARRVCFKVVRRPFDFARGPMLRSTLFRIGQDRHVLQLTTHHLLHDDWSTGVLLGELTELYETFANDIAPPLDYLPFQYGDYVRWLELQLQENASRLRLSYWKEQLTAASGFHHLATDFPPPGKSSNRGARESRALPAELLDSLKLLGRRERVSLFMILLTGFQTLLHRRSNDEEIGIASCAANRPLPQVEGLIGRFGNDIFLRTNFCGNPTFHELLQRMRGVALSAYADQSLPFGEILKGIAESSTLPFQVMFILQNAQRTHREIPGLTIRPFPFYSGTAKYDLTVFPNLEPGLEVTFEYKTDLFRAATMRRLLDDYEIVLQIMVENPGARVSSFVLSHETKAINGQTVPAIAERMSAGKTTSDTEFRLLELWREAFGEKVGLDQDFFELGGDSLLATRLLARIEKSFSSKLPVSVLLEASTIRQLAQIINGEGTRQPWSSLVPIQPSGTRPALFCVHGHLGEVFYGRNLSHALGPKQPLFGFRSQGLAGELPFHTVPEMAACYLKEVQSVQPVGPYFLSGWCFGGMIAFEMARLLQEEGDEVTLLLLFNTPAPGSLRGWPLTPGYLRRRIVHELKKLGNLGTRQKLTIFRAKTFGLARLTSGTVKTTFNRYLVKDAAANKVKRSLSVADINVAAAKAYRPGIYSGRITMFLTTEARSIYGSDPSEGWAPFATKGIELHSASGDNHTLFRPPFVNTLAEDVQACIAQARPESERSI
jgi:thioesterase domain-containing protein/acyl carrier protein